MVNLFKIEEGESVDWYLFSHCGVDHLIAVLRWVILYEFGDPPPQ